MAKISSTLRTTSRTSASALVPSRALASLCAVLLSTYAATPAAAVADPVPVLIAGRNSTHAPSAASTSSPPSPSLATSPSATAPRDRETRFDIAVHQAPASQVFMQLVSGSAWQILVSPEVTGTITLSLKNTTVLEALDAIRELYGYHYKVSGQHIYVQSNTVQTRVFRISYLPGRRQGVSDIRVSSSSISQAVPPGNGSNSSSGGNSIGSSSNTNNSARQDDAAHIRTTSDNDFWRDVQASLNALLGNHDSNNLSAHSSANATSGTSATLGMLNSSNAAGGSGNGGNLVGMATPVNNGNPSQRRSVVINPSAGVIVVRATPLEMRLVSQYLEALQISVERQVMLEAKILDVELNKDSQTGVNWSAFGKFLNGTLSMAALAPGMALNSDGQVDIPTAVSSLNGSGNFYGVAFRNTNFSALLSFLETQGKVQVLSSPRIASVNNQKAILKVGSDEMYVTGVSSSISSTGTSTTAVPSVTLQPFFSGIALDVTPQIDKDGMVMLHVHPAISTVSEKQKNINLGSLGSYRLPLASSTVSETDSIVRVRDGQIVAIGGLMKEQQSEEISQVPGLGDTPVVGGLFRQKSTVMHKRELVILMKPTVINDQDAWPTADTQTPQSKLQPFAPAAPAAPAAAPAAPDSAVKTAP